MRRRRGRIPGPPIAASDGGSLEAPQKPIVPADSPTVPSPPVMWWGETPRPEYRIVLRRAEDLRPGDVVRRMAGERDEHIGDRWRYVSRYGLDTPEIPSGACGPWVWDCDLSPGDLTLWEVQVPVVPPALVWTTP